MNTFIYIGLAFFVISGICVGGFTTSPQQRGIFIQNPKMTVKLKTKSRIGLL